VPYRQHFFCELLQSGAVVPQEHDEDTAEVRTRGWRGALKTAAPSLWQFQRPSSAPSTGIDSTGHPLRLVVGFVLSSLKARRPRRCLRAEFPWAHRCSRPRSRTQLANCTRSHRPTRATAPQKTLACVIRMMTRRGRARPPAWLAITFAGSTDRTHLCSSANARRWRTEADSDRLSQAQVRHRRVLGGVRPPTCD